VRSDVREYGKIANTPTAVKALAAKQSRAGNELRFCDEAIMCGPDVKHMNEARWMPTRSLRSCQLMLCSAERALVLFGFTETAR
jgi:hypothetical protein